jgi:hypothetical protein
VADIRDEVRAANILIRRSTDPLEIDLGASMLLNVILMISSIAKNDTYARHAQGVLDCGKKGAHIELATHLAALREFDVDAYV